MRECPVHGFLEAWNNVAGAVCCSVAVGRDETCGLELGERVEVVPSVPVLEAFEVLAELSAPVGRLNLYGPDVDQSDVNLIVSCTQRLRAALSGLRGVSVTNEGSEAK
jgi:hypothetical protein